MRLKQKFRFNPEKGLTELPILWYGIILFSSLALFFGIIIFLNESLALKLDGEGFNNFVTIYKVPLSILAFIIPYIAFIATTHRSIQSKEQIITSKSQNIFSNYFKHLEEFQKYIGVNNSIETSRFKNIRITHRILFADANIGNYSFNKNILKVIKEGTKKCVRLLEDLKIEGNDTNNIFFGVQIEFNKIIDAFEGNYLAGELIIWEDREYRMMDKANQIIHNVKAQAKFIESIITFDQFVDIPKSLIKLKEIDTNAVPSYTKLPIEENKSIVCDVFSKS